MITRTFLHNELIVSVPLVDFLFQKASFWFYLHLQSFYCIYTNLFYYPRQDEECFEPHFYQY